MRENILKVKNRKEFREWLNNHHDNEKECYINVKRGKPKDDKTFYYIDAVEEALCFGWIDSSYVHINGRIMQRFSPRRKNSIWSELNKERVRRLEKLGLMTDAGRKLLPNMDKNFKIDKEIEAELKKARIFTQFKKFPELYQRIRLYNLAFYKNKNKETYEKMLIHLIEETKKGKMFGEWNDYGRLLEY